MTILTSSRLTKIVESSGSFPRGTTVVPGIVIVLCAEPTEVIYLSRQTCFMTTTTELRRFLTASHDVPFMKLQSSRISHPLLTVFLQKWIAILQQPSSHYVVAIAGTARHTRDAVTSKTRQSRLCLNVISIEVSIEVSGKQERGIMTTGAPSRSDLTLVLFSQVFN